MSYSPRVKDLTEDLGNNTFKKIGVTYDAMGGIQYDVNVTLHFKKDEQRQWFFEVVKTQGTLDRIFPEGRQLSEFPMQDVLAWADKVKPSTLVEKDSVTIAEEQAREGETLVKSFDALKNFAASIGIPTEEVGPILRSAGYHGFKPEYWDDMVEVLQASVQEETN